LIESIGNSKEELDDIDWYDYYYTYKRRINGLIIKRNDKERREERKQTRANENRFISIDNDNNQCTKWSKNK
jgi:hypothetical protein